MLRLVSKALLVGLTTGVLLAGCAPTGDGFAASLAERIIIGIGDDITPAYPTPRDADYLAAWALENPRLPSVGAPVDYAVETLGWEGNSGDEAGAAITFRIGVHVHADGPNSFGEASYKEGRSTRCWELTIFGLHDYDSLKQREITCPEDAVALTPHPEPLPAFPDDIDARLTQALQGATIATIDDQVRAVFTEDFYSIVSDEQDGEVAVALGIPSELECVVGVIHADGSVEVLRGWQRVLLQPGETGCSPSLYFTPIVTH